MPVQHVAVIGGGIGGLSVALALAQRGISSDIFEQAPILQEVGAGLQLSPNASHILDKLGLLSELQSLWMEPEDVALFSGITLQKRAAVPVRTSAKQRWHAPYGVLHRATLQNVLLKAISNQPLCQLHLGATIETATFETLANHSARRFDVIIGADGVWSKTRKMIAHAPSPRFTGDMAWRFTLPFAQAPAFLNPYHVSAFLGPGAHLVCYPLKETGSFNFVAVTGGKTRAETWNYQPSQDEKTLTFQRFTRWNAEFSALFQKANQATCWPIYETTDGAWHNDRDTVLIGDAAHAMTPYAAQGAAMALEDAYELAAALCALPLNEAFHHFTTIRKPRIARLRARARFNRFVYHARGPAAWARDLVLKHRSGEELAADLDWLYGYRP